MRQRAIRSRWPVAPACPRRARAAARAPDTMTMEALIRRIDLSTPRSDAGEPLLTREWLVTNGLGGYASGTIGGDVTRRYHGLLIAALPAPLGRVMMLSQVAETFHTPASGGEP